MLGGPTVLARVPHAARRGATLAVLAALVAASGAAFAPRAGAVADLEPFPDGPVLLVADLLPEREVPRVASPAWVGLELVADEAAAHAEYRLLADRAANVVAVHLHLAPDGETGPVVAVLLGPRAPGGGPAEGVVASGTLGAGDLGGPLAGRSIADLVAEAREGNVYANLHTDDGTGEPGTGPGDHPAGEARGPLRDAGALPACPAAMRLDARANGDVRVAWRPVPGAAGYVVYRAAGRDGDAFERVGAVAHPRAAFTDDTTQPGRTYRYLVAVVADGDDPERPTCAEAPAASASPFFPSLLALAAAAAASLAAFVAFGRPRA